MEDDKLPGQEGMGLEQGKRNAERGGRLPLSDANQSGSNQNRLTRQKLDQKCGYRPAGPHTLHQLQECPNVL